VLSPRSPKTDVAPPRLMEEILQAVEVVGCRGQGAPGSLGDTAMADRGRSWLTDDGRRGFDDGLTTVLSSRCHSRFCSRACGYGSITTRCVSSGICIST